MKKSFIAFGFVFILIVFSAFLATAWFRARQVKFEQARADQAAREAKLHKRAEPAPTPVVAPEPAVPAPTIEPTIPIAHENAPPKASPRGNRSPASPGSNAPNPGGKQVKDELARVALSFVGADPEAEQYWFG